MTSPSSKQLDWSLSACRSHTLLYNHQISGATQVMVDIAAANRDLRCLGWGGHRNVVEYYFTSWRKTKHSHSIIVLITNINWNEEWSPTFILLHKRILDKAFQWWHLFPLQLPKRGYPSHWKDNLISCLVCRTRSEGKSTYWLADGQKNPRILKPSPLSKMRKTKHWLYICLNMTQL